MPVRNKVICKEFDYKSHRLSQKAIDFWKRWIGKSIEISLPIPASEINNISCNSDYGWIIVDEAFIADLKAHGFKITMPLVCRHNFEAGD